MTRSERTARVPRSTWVMAAALAGITLSAAALVAQSKRDVSVTGRKYTYVVADSSGPEIRVRQDDIVIVTFTAADIAHTFTISDHYRIDRRAEPGKPVVFRFLADKAGEFEIRCTLTLDERCAREMRGRLIVTGK